MKAWFTALSERERNLVLIGGFLLLAIIVFFYGWKPLQRYKADLERDISATLEDREFIRDAERQVKELEVAKKSKRVVDTTTSVQILANPLLQRYQLNKPGVLVRSEAKSKDAVSLKLENAAFDPLIRFIGDMERQHNIKVSSMALIPTKTIGLTGVDLTLER
ncbi:MAG: type II secretion system protein GspM [Thiolinea sp.]